MFFFRVDLGKKNGLGHFYRVKSLISYLRIKNYKIILDKFPNSTFFENERKNIISLYDKNLSFKNEIDDANKIINSIKINKDDIFIKDSYRLNYNWEKKISLLCKKLIIIDDFPNKKHYADFYINHNPFFDILDKEKLKKLKTLNKKNCKFLLGTNFALFNTKYKKKIISDFVFYNGGSGNPLIYEKIITKISNIKNYRIVLIIGALVSKKNYHKSLKKFKKNKNIKIVYKSNNILDYLKGTKIFISSAGISMFEASFLKIPTLIFKMIKKQNLNDEDYERLGHYFTLEKKDLNHDKKVFNLLKLMIKNRLIIKSLMNKSNLNIIKISKNFKESFKF